MHVIKFCFFCSIHSKQELNSRLKKKSKKAKKMGNKEKLISFLTSSWATKKKGSHSGENFLDLFWEYTKKKYLKEESARRKALKVIKNNWVQSWLLYFISPWFHPNLNHQTKLLWRIQLLRRLFVRQADFDGTKHKGICFFCDGIKKRVF